MPAERISLQIQNQAGLNLLPMQSPDGEEGSVKNQRKFPARSLRNMTFCFFP